MTTSKFWRRAAKRFRRLQTVPPQPGEVQRASHNGLCAWWRPGGWDDGNPYHFFDDGDDLEANRNFERLFKIVAESAAVELGYPGGGEAAVFAWLDHLRRAGIYVTSSTEGSWIIHRVCDASAEYCLKCETDVRTGVKAPERALEESAVSPSLAASSLSLPGDNINSVSSANTEDVPDFATEGLRIIAVVGYRRKWMCSEAALARAARVHRSDLSKWKKLRLPAGSDKSARIEKALTQNAKPVRPTPPIEF